MIIKLEESPDFITAIRLAVRSELDSVRDELFKELDEKTWTLQDVADFMDVSTQTVKFYMRIGLPYFQERQVIRFLRSDVVRWMKEAMNKQKGMSIQGGEIDGGTVKRCEDRRSRLRN